MAEVAGSGLRAVARPRDAAISGVAWGLSRGRLAPMA
jgi:hypothetical protein